MKDLPRNFGAFLVELGYEPRPKHEGLAAPAIVPWGPPLRGSAMIETKTEVAAHIDESKRLVGRSFPAGGMGSAWF